jgi:hypothetical protein
VLLREARKSGLVVEQHGSKWRVTNPETGGLAFVPTQGAGRSLHNIRAELRRMAEPPAPMVAAVSPPAPEEDAMGWPIEQLLTLAEQQGVKVDVRGGLLHVSGPVECEPFARLVRDRETDVLDHLNPPTESEEPMPRVGDVARIDIPAPIADVAADARQVWQVIRGLAATQGDEKGLNAGVAGVLWRGAMGRVMRETHPEWADDHRRDISTYLERTGHTKCQSRHANPPVWWIRSEWDDGGLTVTKTTPKPAAKPKTAAANGAKPAVTLPDVGDPLALLTAVAKRVSDAEQRAADAEELLTEALAENEQLRAERDQYKAKVDEISNAFRVLAGGSQ